MLHPRARTMLLLSTPALIIGIASSLVLIVVMKVASVLQQFLWERLPVSIGIAQDSPVWIIGMLTLTGIMVGLVIRYSHGHAGPDPACEPLIGMPVPTSALPGLLAALILGLAGGVSLGPEHPHCETGLDHSRLCRHHRRAIWHPRCRCADIFANAE